MLSHNMRENVAFLFFTVVKHSACSNVIKMIVMEMFLFCLRKVGIEKEAGYKTKSYYSNLCTPAIIINALFPILGQNLPPPQQTNKSQIFSCEIIKE